MYSLEPFFPSDVLKLLGCLHMLGGTPIGGLALMAIPILFSIHVIGNFATGQLNKKEVIMENASKFKLLNPIFKTTKSWCKAIGASALGGVL